MIGRVGIHCIGGGVIMITIGGGGGVSVFLVGHTEVWLESDPVAGGS